MAVLLSCCPGVVTAVPVLLSLLLCRPALPCAGPVPGCCSGAARPGLASQKASLATSQGRNTLAGDTSDPLTKRQLQDSPFFVPLQSGLDTKTNESNCNPEPYVHIPLQFLLHSAPLFSFPV